MKKLIYLLFITLMNFIVISCTVENTEQIDNKNSSDAVLKQASHELISPSGKVLANDLKELKRIVIKNSKEENITVSDIEIESTNFYENTDYTFAVVDCSVKSEFRSLLIPIFLKDNLSLLFDKHHLFIIKNEAKISKSGSIINLLVTNYDTKAQRAYRCQGGDCCSWQQTGPNRFDCGCYQDAVIITTSGGCEVEIL